MTYRSDNQKTESGKRFPAILGRSIAAILCCGALVVGGIQIANVGPANAGTESLAFKASTLNTQAMVGDKNAGIDTSNCNNGFVGACAKSSKRLKLAVIRGDKAYYYDMPKNGNSIFAPLNMGNGSYSIVIFVNTTGDKYAQLLATTCDVSLSNSNAPYMVSTLYCSYNAKSKCVAKAKELTKKCKTETDKVDAIYKWVTKNVTYDKKKAAKLAGGTGYIPNPDSTLKSKTGICFDYASLTAAMLRSQGIPCKIVTGYVGKQNLYHAWNMVFVNGGWKAYKINAKSNTWTIADPTFDAAGAGQYTGDGSSYADRYIY